MAPTPVSIPSSSLLTTLFGRLSPKGTRHVFRAKLLVNAMSTSASFTTHDKAPHPDSLHEPSLSELGKFEKLNHCTNDLVKSCAEHIYKTLADHMRDYPSSPTVFDERRFATLPAAVTTSNTLVSATQRNVSEFFARAVHRAKFSSAVIAGIVLAFDRIVAVLGQGQVHAYSWRVLVLLAILLGNKVVDDRALPTTEMKPLFAYAAVMGPVVDVRKLADMEITLLKMLDFRMHISSRDIRALLDC